MPDEVLNIAAQEVATAHFSFLSLFWQADWIVKTVIIILLVCSVLCWAIIVHKYLSLARSRLSAHSFEARFWSGESIPDLVKNIGEHPRNSLETILTRCFEEWQRSKSEVERGDGERVLGRIASLARSAIDQESQNNGRYLSLLASFGSACPFIGLFGTVWGIMNSFSAIAMSKQTSLAVVAPGIAEALFATALGLIAAIPATLAYNKFLGDIENKSQNDEQFATEVLAIFSRQLGNTNVR